MTAAGQHWLLKAQMHIPTVLVNHLSYVNFLFIWLVKIHKGDLPVGQYTHTKCKANSVVYHCQYITALYLDSKNKIAVCPVQSAALNGLLGFIIVCVFWWASLGQATPLPTSRHTLSCTFLSLCYTDQGCSFESCPCNFPMKSFQIMDRIKANSRAKSKVANARSFSVLPPKLPMWMSKIAWCSCALSLI